MDPAPRIRSRSWLIGTTLRRSRSQWRLLLVVVAVAILACTLISSLGLLVFATEQGGVRSALTSISTSQTGIDVRVVRQHVPLSRASRLVKNAVRKELGDSVPFSSSSFAMTEPAFVPEIQTSSGLTYFGEYDNFRANSKLVAGHWAGKWSGGTAAIPVAIPETASRAQGLQLGSTFAISHSPADLTALVVGIYSVNAPNSSYWARDRLHGTGNDPLYFGPLVAAPGTIDAAKMDVASLDISFTPTFNSLTIDELGPLVRRLASGQTAVPRQLASVSATVSYKSGTADAVSGVVSGLTVTRSTIVVVSLMLLVLAVAAMGQTARSFNDARAGERQLLRSRGASAGNILALATLEAVVVGVITAGVSPPLSTLVYRVLAAQPAMVAAHMPKDAGIPSITWVTAAGVSLVFVVVLIAPLLRRSRSFAGGEPSRGRQGAASGFMRSGLDIAIFVLAGIAYWQLVSYHGHVDAAAPLAIDPILVAGPALVLGAGALLCVRLIPLASKLILRVGDRARGSVIPLASWEIGRRSQRATSAVLLLSLALAVGTFGLSFLATWKQSQLDQATFAVGPPVRVLALPDPDVQAQLLAKGAVGTPQPVIRRIGQLLDPGSANLPGAAPTGPVVTVLGLTAEGRTLIDRGRLSHLGGDEVKSRLAKSVTPATGVVLPGAVYGVSATIQVAVRSSGLPGVEAHVYAILEDGMGLLTTVSMGTVSADNTPQDVRGFVQLPPNSNGLTGPVRLVGFQATFATAKDSGASLVNAQANADVLVKDLAVLHTSSSQSSASVTDSQSVTVDSSATWFGNSAEPDAPVPTVGPVPSGWQFDLGVDVPSGLELAPATFALVGWSPSGLISVVVPTALAKTLNLTPPSNMTVEVQDVLVPILIVGTTSLVPGTASSDALSNPNSGFAASSSNPNIMVLDQELLERSLAQSGVHTPMVDEWWVNVPVGRGQAYLNGVANPVGAVSSETLGLQLQQAPLRVATQAALWLAIVAGGLLAAVGFAVHSATTLRSRRLELAQLRAIGLSRNKLVALITAESLLITVLGAVFGTAIGVLLALLVGPLVAASPDGSPPVPSVAVQIPWSSIGLLIIGLAAALVLVVFVVARVQRSVEPAELLRGGMEP
ncbi:MAG: ABC transporter permease [Pseudolysinimonas sp.]